MNNLRLMKYSAVVCYYESMRSTKTQNGQLPWRLSFEALGTQWRIDTKIQATNHLIEAILRHVESFDKTYSRFRTDSLIHAISTTAGQYTFPENVTKLVTLYRTLYDVTSGKVTPLIGNTLEDAGYNASYSFTPTELGKVPAWDEVMTWDGRMMRTSTPITIDFGAAGKGYLVDMISQILIKDRHLDFVIDASGDIYHRGTSKNVVGLEHPFKSDTVIGALNIQNASLCASAVNRRAWGDGLHHIFDPTTLTPVKNIIATWVVAESALIADGIATALFFTEPEILQHHFAFDFVRMHQNNTIDYSSRFDGELYI